MLLAPSAAHTTSTACRDSGNSASPKYPPSRALRNMPGGAAQAGWTSYSPLATTIVGDGQITSGTHPRGAMLRAYNKATGKEVGALWMPAPQSGGPMTYVWQGKQYLVVAVSGGTYTGEYIAFALPDPE